MECAFGQAGWVEGDGADECDSPHGGDDAECAAALPHGEASEDDNEEVRE